MVEQYTSMEVIATQFCLRTNIRKHNRSRGHVLVFYLERSDLIQEIASLSERSHIKRDCIRTQL
jgi:hypothetical protein